MKQRSVPVYAAMSFVALAATICGLVLVIIQNYQLSSLSWNVAALLWLTRGDTPDDWRLHGETRALHG